MPRVLCECWRFELRFSRLCSYPLSQLPIPGAFFLGFSWRARWLLLCFFLSTPGIWFLVSDILDRGILEETWSLLWVLVQSPVSTSYFPETPESLMYAAWISYACWPSSTGYRELSSSSQGPGSFLIFDNINGNILHFLPYWFFSARYDFLTNYTNDHWKYSLC